MALTPEQLAARKLGIGGSDAPKIVKGEWHALWLDKTGRSQPEDLSGVWPVQLGIATEAVNLDFYGKKTGNEAGRRGEVVIHPKENFLRCTLDGFDAKRGAVVQAKHVNSRSVLADVIERYRPQVMHESIVCGTTLGVLSVIIGSDAPVLHDIDLDEWWAADYIEQCRTFWGFVERDEEPSLGRPMMEPPPVPPEKMRTVDMTGNNEWASKAHFWLTNRVIAKDFDAIVKDLKAMVEPDVGTAKGHGIIVARDKRGISIKESKGG